MLIKHPQEETGANRKLSRPWFGLYRITGIENTGVIAEQIYGPIKDQIRVHLQWVTRCPADFPAGHYWYCNGPGCPPKWIDRFINDQVNSLPPTSQTECD